MVIVNWHFFVIHRLNWVCLIHWIINYLYLIKYRIVAWLVPIQQFNYNLNITISIKEHLLDSSV